ncbi:hypothetical protein ES702_07114 [subsurface metagenome]
MEIKEILLDGKQFEAACKEAGLEKSLNSYTQKISDQRVSEGIKTFEKNRGDKTDQERIEELETQIKDLKSGIAKGDLDTQIKAELKKEGLSEGLIKYIRIDDPDKVGESVKALKDDILDLKQKEIDAKLKEGGIPSKGETIAVDSVIEKFVEGKNVGKTEGPFEGKESENKSEGDQE